MKLILVLSILLLAGCSTSVPEVTVMITNLATNSGGSGSIVGNSKSHSEILTNAHVCNVVRHGGLVHTYTGKEYSISSFLVSKMHDLCLITVMADLGAHTEVSNYPPIMFENIVVSGHPKLLPLIITKGHVTGRKMVQVLTGFRDCTPKDLENPLLAFFCNSIGQLPVVQTYETVIVSALIQPGSSGSGVYGAEGKISAVIFAGAGELGFGVAVPWEYVYNFINVEVKSLDSVLPDATSTPDASPSKSAMEEKFSTVCRAVTDLEQKRFCKAFNANFIPGKH